MKPKDPLPQLCTDLRELQRQRVACQKSRIMIDNRLTAQVATMAGYNAGMEEAERGKRFKEAQEVVAGMKGEVAVETDCRCAPLILATLPAIEAFKVQEKAYEKEMEKLAKQLHVADWMTHPDQRGFGWLSLAIIIGECDDLNNYANPGKLWRRMGCAPYENSKGENLQGSTHRRRKSLTSAEWEDYGYCPRRRSVVYVFVGSLIKGNKGPYKARYDTKKAEAIARNDPEWTPECKVCKATGKTKAGAVCKECKGKGYLVMRPHMHGMLLMGKLLLKNLWLEWTGQEYAPYEE